MRCINFSVNLIYKQITQSRSEVLIDKKKKKKEKKKKEKRTCHVVDFVVLVDQRGKIKESGRVEKYLDLPRKLKTQWNIKETVIEIVISVLGTVYKGLESRLDK